MIEKMQKLSLLILHSSKDKFLSSLQNLGVAHLEADKSIQDEKINTLKERVNKLEKVEKFLVDFKNSNKLKPEDKKVSNDEEFDRIITKVESIKSEIDNTTSQIENLKKEISQLNPWGIFDEHDITKLEPIGLSVKFFSAQKSKFDKIDKNIFPIEVISEIKGTVYFVLISEKGFDISALDATEERIPLKNSNFLTSEIDDLKKLKDSKFGELKNYIGYIEVIKTKILDYENKITYQIANASLLPEAEGTVLYISGWIPKRQVKDVESFLNKEDVAFLIEEPKPTDNIPIKLRNNFIGKLFEPLMKIFSLPNYFEIDTTVFIAPFYTIFFGMCLGDLGYGALLFLILTIALIFIKNKAIKPIIVLGMVLSASTAIFGFFLNGAFGFSISDQVMKVGILPESLKPFIILSNQTDVMILSMALGFIQILVGLVLKTINSIRNGGFWNGLQPIGNFLFILGVAFAGVIYGGGDKFKISLLNVGQIFTNFAGLFGLTLLNLTLTFIISGTLLVLLFNGMQNKFYIRPLLGLWEMYNAVTGILGDVLSYIRLFALGLSGGLLGSAINQIAGMTNNGTVIGIISMLFIMVLGHTLNLLLSILGSFVHPLRLTFVEFYKNIGFTGGGIAYTPFSHKTINK
ncbi:MAG TPA: V-type ATPase 116kDa subunit family protein [Spirochaetota bacterium]|nr:V-type ATPase 116kDa subunit family protein [Spirochaetota bacterium]